MRLKVTPQIVSLSPALPEKLACKIHSWHSSSQFGRPLEKTLLSPIFTTGRPCRPSQIPFFCCFRSKEIKNPKIKTSHANISIWHSSKAERSELHTKTWCCCPLLATHGSHAAGSHRRETAKGVLKTADHVPAVAPTLHSALTTKLRRCCR